MIQWLRSFAFLIYVYGMMLVMGVVMAPLALWSREGAWWALRRYSDVVLGAMPWFVGLRAEVRGEIPSGDVVIASKHQSFLDILILTNVLPKPRFIMKRSLRWAPVLGAYAMRVGCAPIDRASGPSALKAMLSHMRAPGRGDGQIVIFPQGTRVAPGVSVDYKPGVAALAAGLGRTVIPAATNGGAFWPRKGVLRKPGVAVLEFLPPIPEGLPRRALMARLESEIEDASDRLLAEAREGAPAKA